MKHKSKSFKTINIKNKEYVEVSQRVSYLAFDFDGEYSIQTEYQYFSERKLWVVKATLTLSQEGVTSVYTGLAQELESEEYKKINFTSALENCETSAVGRACAFAGIGLEKGIASANEVQKAINRTPQDRVEPEVVTPSHATPKNDLASTKQKTEILLLLNNKVITNDEKNSMIENINKLTKERASKAITKLEQAIRDRDWAMGQSYEDQISRLRQRAIEISATDIVDILDNSLYIYNGDEERIKTLLSDIEEELINRKKK